MRIALALVATTLGFAALAQAANEPGTIGVARLGSLSVTSAAYVSSKSVDLLGVWQDTRVSCNAKRRLRVHAVVDYVPASGNPRRVARNGTFLDSNCAEGGPNVGFTLTARKLGFACPNGAWKPARYNFLTRTTEPVKTLQATASLIWFKRGPC